MTQQDEGAGWSFNLNPQTDSKKNEYHKPQGEQSDVPEVSNRYIRNNVRDHRTLTGFHSPSLTVGVSGIPGVALRRLGRANKSAVDASTMSNLSVSRFFRRTTAVAITTPRVTSHVARVCPSNCLRDGGMRRRTDKH
jgi:hypothetical protein